MSVNVILCENYPALGYVGDQVSVKPGFARNFLIPRGIAVEASDRNERLLKHNLQGVMRKRAKLRTEAEDLARQIGALKLSFTVKTGDGGRSFGSITTKDIDVALADKGFKLDRRQIRLTEAVRKAGEYVAQIKLHAEVTLQLPFTVVAEAPVAAAPLEGEGKKRRAPRKKSETVPPAAEQN